MKRFARLLVVLFVLSGAVAHAQVCEPNSRILTGGFLSYEWSCTPLQRGDRVRLLLVGGLLFEESETRISHTLTVRVDGITTSPVKSGIIDRRVTIVAVEKTCCDSGVAIAAQYELRAGDSVQLRTFFSSIKIEIVSIDEDKVALKMR